MEEWSNISQQELASLVQSMGMRFTVVACLKQLVLVEQFVQQCPMMEDFIKKTVENEERRKTRLKNIQLKVHVLKPDDPEKNFISEIINKEHKKSFRTTNCSSLDDQKRGYYIFHCRRSGNVFERSHRAVGCKAYISFKVRNDWKGHKVVVQRIFTQHNGHDSSEEDGHFQQLHPQLVDQIKKWITLGVKPDVILLQANEWSKAQGEANYHSREFFVTPEDIHNIRTSMLRERHLDKDDCKSTDKLLTGPFKDDVIFYQPLGKDQDLIIVLQTEFMRKDLQNNGSNIVFFDATYCVNQYSFPLFTLLVRDDHGHGFPVAYIITSSETQETLKLALQKLRPVFPKPPRCFMVDKDMSEINALNAVFPESDVLLCWYHVLQAVVRWLMKSDSGVCGPHSSNTRREILDYFKKMKACAMKTDFDRVAKEFLKDFSHCQEVCKYFQRYWEPISHRWADYGRCYNHGNSETNNLIERDQSLVVIFRSVKKV
ncbi:zinc finger SWIM domain-containing 1-like protein [Labeo rohita]|uniref:Zinc finger SWIM domain-containing 1-like protein n=1 Tax=Labeo rohita TaxID=84645 RepID=A0A498MD80_LABRO|nr:zinc finger SWIM domain-containing 1-like protein [Labeo rohita]